ncbi:hypothetical protein [Phenylobacterium soli]|uniref:hypothetical protein n=1 Tax=Phenylobacterium soli TaxID=2170551 RepID=UPI001401C2C5|nr:hypothetical protein [Phenylobacterium soli]
MTDRPDDPNETPMQRALRLKKAAQDAKSAPSGAKLSPTQARRQPAGASKPWMKR